MRQGVIIGFLLLVAFWLMSLIWGLVGKAHIAVNEARRAQDDYQALDERRRALEADIAELATERGKDTAIRTSFGVARPGEEVIVVVPPTVATSTPPFSWWKWLFSWL